MTVPEELVLAETGRDSEGVTSETPPDNGEVSITKHSAVYQRAPARGAPTVLEAFASSVNQTPGPRSAISVLGSEVTDAWPITYIKGDVQVSGKASVWHGSRHGRVTAAVQHTSRSDTRTVVPIRSLPDKGRWPTADYILPIQHAVCINH